MFLKSVNFILEVMELSFLLMRAQEDIECVFESMTARGSIYISNYSAAQNLTLLKSKGIKAVLSVARRGLLAHSKEDVPRYLYIPMEDHEEYQIVKYFPTTFDFIEQARKETNVLIHCMVGVSRSVTVAIAYLLRKYHYSLGQIIALLQRRRKKINPNPGFLTQLQKYSESLGIRCDFYEKKVPAVRDSSLTRQVKAHSLRKQKTPLKVSGPLTPILYKERQVSPQKSLFAPAFKEQLKMNQLNLQGFDVMSMGLQLEKGKDQKTSAKKQVSIQLKPIIDMKKSISVEEPRERRRSSIEEKISKIRQKILKTQHMADGKPGAVYLKAKEQSYNLRSRQSSPIKSYLTDKTFQIGVSTPATLPRQLQSLKPDGKVEATSNTIRRYIMDEPNNDIFTSQLKIEQKAFYLNGSRQNPRFTRGKEEMAT